MLAREVPQRPRGSSLPLQAGFNDIVETSCAMRYSARTDCEEQGKVWCRGTGEGIDRDAKVGKTGDRPRRVLDRCGTFGGVRGVGGVLRGQPSGHLRLCLVWLPGAELRLGVHTVVFRVPGVLALPGL